MGWGIMLNIAVIIGEIQLDTQRKVLKGITNASVLDGNNIFVYSLTLTKDGQTNRGEAFVALNDNFDIYDGFIIYAESIYDLGIRERLIQKIKKSNKPVASIDYQIEGCINVSSNNEQSMHDLARHLITEHGVRTINYIGGPADSIDANTRKNAVLDEMKRNNMPINPDRFFVGDFYARSGRRGVEYFESKGFLEADAYICANDQMALGAFYALNERGIKVPDDTIMTGYDYIFEAANHFPQITSVKRFEEKMGEVAYTNIVNLIEEKEYTEKITVDSEIVCAESCGCQAGKTIPVKAIVNGYANRTLRDIRFAEIISDFSAEVTSVKSYDGLCSELINYMPRLGGIDYVAGLYEEPGNVTRLQACVDCFNNPFMVRKQVDNDIIANIVRNADGGNLYIINSVHFGEKCYGFTIIRNSDMPINSEFYKIFEINLGNTIEHINNYQKMQKMIGQLDELWTTDPMTGIYNRAGFNKYAEIKIAEAKTHQRNLFLVFVDIDGLKKVNDELGHDMGDILICDMANALKSVCKNDIIMRYGGDEFVILHIQLPDAYITAAEDRLKEAILDFMEDNNDEI